MRNSMTIEKERKKNRELKIYKKILKNLDELETQYQELSGETRDELEREFQGGTLNLLKKLQRKKQGLICW